MDDIPEELIDLVLLMLATSDEPLSADDITEEKSRRSAPR
jgi:hypothetical protein